MGFASRKKVAIVGTGISGLGSAWLLHPHHDITLYEKNDYVGGHSRTVKVKIKDKSIAVDTGFIVFNKRNYPLLTRLFEHLDVPIAESSMSFGASIDNGWLEYGTQSLSHLFAQKQNLLKRSFWAMVFDILKFNRRAGTYLFRDPSFTLGDCLDELAMGPWFRQYFLLAMGGAIWSTPLAEMLKFPASTFVRFFENHGLLTLNDHPQWYTVRGGSQEYVRRLSEPFKDRIRLGCGVAKVWRGEKHITIEDLKGEKQTYDQVIFSCHANQALTLIANPSEHEKSILSAFKYQPNRAILHGDTSFMPKRLKAWASWVYLSEGKIDGNSNISLSYWMNHLQPLESKEPLIVTLNPGRDPDPRLVYDDYMFDHPLFDADAIQNQSRICDIQGNNGFWFCGSYQRYGFHEDGLSSAVKMVNTMGVPLPW